MLEFNFFYFLFSCYFSYIKGSLNIFTHLSMKITLVDPNLVRFFFVLILLILVMVRTLKNNYFLVRTKLGYLGYNHKSLFNSAYLSSRGRLAINKNQKYFLLSHHQIAKNLILGFGFYERTNNKQKQIFS